jgi:hypothetical protein
VDWTAHPDGLHADPHEHEFFYDFTNKKWQQKGGRGTPFGYTGN